MNAQQLDADPAQAVDGLVRAIRDLTSDPNYKLVADVFSEFLFVKEQNNKLSSSHQVVLEEYRKFRNELEDQKAELDKEKKEMEIVIQEKGREIMQLTAIRARLEGDLEDTQKQLDDESHRALKAAEKAAADLANLQEVKAKELAEFKVLKEKEHAELQERAAKEFAHLKELKDKELASFRALKDKEFAEFKEIRDKEIANFQGLTAKEVNDLKTLKEKEFVDFKALKEKEFVDFKELKEKEFIGFKQLKERELADFKELKEKEYAALEAAKAAVEEEKRNSDAVAAEAAAKAAGEIAQLTEIKTGLEKVKVDNETEIGGLKGIITGLEAARAELELVKTVHESEIASLKAKVEALEAEQKRLGEDLETARQEVSSLQGTIEEKNKEIESLQESHRAAEEQIASLQQTVDDKNSEIEELHGRLSAEEERAEKAEAHGQDLQDRLDDTEESLRITTDKLEDLEDCRIELQTEHEDAYVAVLDKIWTTIVTLVEGTFRSDIEEPILSDTSCWNNLRNSPYLKHATQLQIPLPQSNTSAAKGMRISAVLAVLSRAMHKHLFRPVYLLEDDDDNLVKFLRALEDEDPTRETHIRATLLATMPERQLEQGARRVKTVIREVSWVVQHMLTALQFEAFCSGLEAACKLACEQWMRIQLSHMKIEPYFGPPYEDFDWQVLDLPEFADAAEETRLNPELSTQLSTHNIATHNVATSNVARQAQSMADIRLETIDGSDSGAPSVSASAPAPLDRPDTTSTYQPDNRDQDRDHNDNDDEDGPIEGEVDPDDILLVVWPSMCCVENGELMSITQGLVISKEQARPALEEVRVRARSVVTRPGSRRARTMSQGTMSRKESPRGKANHFMSLSRAASEIAASEVAVSERAVSRATERATDTAPSEATAASIIG
ncbi:hypothetical protein QBC35DRAFT_257633 [Podospora australis]|uniref:Mei5 protein n=1 Tax=Podospora australis TaxID=1536484 RepID=A0AAN6X110_9PEZI|nr:hypothetical protein QBC35DRAFT_257633 [Podospora australis]